VHEGSDRRNPARWRGNLDKLFAAPRKVSPVKHHDAAPYEKVPALMAALKAKNSTSALCLRFTILTAARSGEARGATWAEIDEKAKVWVIPANRMKAGREHKVPLTDDALAILTAMKPLKTEGSDLVFPGPTGALMSDVAINKTLHAILPA
jgi:integrase